MVGLRGRWRRGWCAAGRRALDWGEGGVKRLADDTVDSVAERIKKTLGGGATPPPIDNPDAEK